MATSRGLAEFALRMRAVAHIFEDRMEDFMRKVGFGVHQVAVETTPFDTGRARNNWVLSVGAPLRGVERRPDRSGSEALSLGEAAVGTFQIAFGSIFLTNSVPYIIPLENGRSPQARTGISGPAIMAGIQIAQREGNRILERLPLRR